MTMFKVLNEDGSAYHGGGGKWHLPKGERPGRWMPRIENPVLCWRGYHLVEDAQLLGWLGPAIWVAEGRGQSISDGEKSVWQQARLLYRVEGWNERAARLFAADCAEHVAHLYTLDTEWQPSQTIAVVRRYANGEATQEELAAARSAAWDAAWAAAWAAAWTAWAAARAAARAAGEAVWGAARAAEREWQWNRLQGYLP